jgi:hypothetical protein
MIETSSLPDRRSKRIRNVSRLFRILCGLGVVFGCLMAIASWFAPITNPSKLSFHFGTPEAQTPPKVSTEATADQKEIRVRFSLSTDDDEAASPPIKESIKPGFRWTLRPMIFGMTLFWTLGVGVLYRLFKLYERGMIFTAANVRCIKWLGGWMLVSCVLSNVIQISKLIIYDCADVDLRISTRFFVGILVLLVAWIMEEGGKIQEENTLTI